MLTYFNFPQMGLKVGRLPSKSNCFIYFNKSPLDMIENDFYSIIKALFVLQIFQFLSSQKGHVEKTT